MVGLGGHGVLATFDGHSEGPALMVRCELDALPIEETNGFAHRSVFPGVSHKCGHDGHMAVVCGLAEVLAQRRPGRGKVHLLFQPAEETGTGARAVWQGPKFAAVKPDMGVALHNFPHAPKHAILLRGGIITAAVCGLIICLRGRTAHAAQPEHGLNPTLAICELLHQSYAPGFTGKS
jgi:amidohydrolase